MSDEAVSPNKLQMKHAITTVLACLSLIKYNAVLGDEQKKELIGDITATLQFLQCCLVEDMTSETIQALYGVYHMYIDVEKGNRLGALVMRFHEVMAAIDDVQLQLERGSGGYDVRNMLDQHSSFEDQLHRVRGFIADLYYMLMEFVRALAAALPLSDVHIDAEEVISIQKKIAEQREEYRTFSSERLAALFSIYDQHQQLQASNGSLSHRINDILDFLEVVQGGPGHDKKREDLLARLHTSMELLNDMSQLLSSYQQALAELVKDV